MQGDLGLPSLPLPLLHPLSTRTRHAGALRPRLCLDEPEAVQLHLPLQELRRRLVPDREKET